MKLDHPNISDLSIYQIKSMLKEDRRFCHFFINIRKVVLFYRYPLFRDILNNGDVILNCDGVWVRRLGSLFKMNISNVFGGEDIMQQLLPFFSERGMRVYFLGSRKEVLDRLQLYLERHFKNLKVAGMKDGYYGKSKEADVISEIKSRLPEVVFIGMPSPYKEMLGCRIFREVPAIRYVVGVGGAFEVIAGVKKRAPVWLRRLGFEWFFRCVQNPRFFSRYLYDFFLLNFIVIKKVGKWLYGFFKKK